ncbi:hypothetical protein [Limimaricola pyoseonensis]|uniref:Uncharacterized protein n=1 Tax=Limimaricola pyoseonensis TaxID=521013 RepID=A0A1G7JFQ9_9RHOB|nr:hypothetical protein [Limimaricola pyoseonensis]SDF23772.1 hypothetical protein SAMN04488567_3707 [Limimaricola pyoseonensis]
MRKEIRTAIAAAALLAGAPAQAETMDAGGVMTGTTAVEQMEVTEGMVISRLSTTYDGVEADDPANPLVGMTGDCSGSTLMGAESAEGSGHCLFTGDGGKVAFAWTATGRDAEGRMTGTWEIAGGSGDWDGASGSGEFASLVNPDGGATENRVSGEITLP